LNNREQIEGIKKKYPAGTRIQLLTTMNDMQGVEEGTNGTVTYVDDMGTIHMRWDNVRGLGLIPGEDNFKILSRPDEEMKESENHSKEQAEGMGGISQ